MGWLTLQNAGTMFAIALGIIGLLLNLDSRRAEIRKRKRGIDAVHLLINLEIRNNLDRLWKLWDKLSSEQPRRSQSDAEVDQRASTLAAADVPHWTMLMWNAHATSVNNALDTIQIGGVMALYEKLERLNYLQEDVINAHAIAFQPRKPSPGADGMDGVPISYEAMLQLHSDMARVKEAATARLEKYREFEELAVEVLKIGNPLQDDQRFTRPPSQRGFT